MNTDEQLIAEIAFQSQFETRVNEFYQAASHRSVSEAGVGMVLALMAKSALVEGDIENWPTQIEPTIEIALHGKSDAEQAQLNRLASLLRSNTKDRTRFVFHHIDDASKTTPKTPIEFARRVMQGQIKIRQRADG